MDFVTFNREASLQLSMAWKPVCFLSDALQYIGSGFEGPCMVFKAISLLLSGLLYALRKTAERAIEILAYYKFNFT